MADPEYDPFATVAVNAQRWSDFLDSVVAVAATEQAGLLALRARIEAYEPAPTPTPTPTPSPTLALSSPISQPEGNSGTTAFIFTLTLNRDGSANTIPYSYSVTGSGVNPANPADFGGTYPSGNGSFPNPETVRTITILATGDTSAEPNETFTLTVVSPGLAPVTSIGTIGDDDTPPANTLTYQGQALTYQGQPLTYGASA